MKKKWERPVTYVQEFEPNEYVAACIDAVNFSGGTNGRVWADFNGDGISTDNEGPFNESTISTGPKQVSESTYQVYNVYGRRNLEWFRYTYSDPIYYPNFYFDPNTGYLWSATSLQQGSNHS